jgi:hypothetical protein
VRAGEAIRPYSLSLESQAASDIGTWIGDAVPGPWRKSNTSRNEHGIRDVEERAVVEERRPNSGVFCPLVELGRLLDVAEGFALSVPRKPSFR